MAEYRKYLFDNFVIDDESKSLDSSEDIAPEPIAESIDEPAEETAEVVDDMPEEVIDEPQDDFSADNQSYEAPMPSFSQEDIDDAAAKAKEEGYSQGLLAAQNSETARQNTLLEEIKNQLLTIVAAGERQNEDMELNALRFIASSLHKLFPTLQRLDGTDEIKKFLQDNFAQLSTQKSLAFFFNPEMANPAAGLLQKIAAHNDFEGKISIHKDDKLGLSDCRIEWQDGYAERNTDKLLEKLQSLLTNNQQERENG